MTYLTNASADAIIVGAGINGMAIALSLAQHQQQVFIIDAALPAQNQHDQHTYDSRIYALNENSIEYLKKIGVWDLCDEQRIQPIRSMKVLGDRSGELVFNATEKSIDNDSLGVIIESRQMIHALRQCVQQHPRITLFHGDRVSLVELQGEERVVTLEDNRRFGAKLLIASDGVHSATRKLLGINETIIPYQHSAVVANYQSDRDHLGEAKQWFLPDGDILAWLPLPDKKVSMVWSTQHTKAEYLVKASASERITSIIHAVGYGVGALQEITPPQRFPLLMLTVDPLVLDRFMLCGDAAHGVHPMAGQGLNLGLADVSTFMELFEKRGGSSEDVGNPRLLSAYARRRRESILLMQTLTHSLYVGFNSPQPWISMVMNTGMSIINQWPGIKKLLLKQAGHA
ncbi:MAG: hypothetical protein B7Z60_02780 [Ferrovum sp. 37-45-19]|uniref:FAD-dependent monooxygenase n=1 Tax=Ferrovum sp. JA12 TaxID=1356299 RepID=UPI000703BB92|nr:FAD-dependent monooxygenase [Ferrovum sp. JA12]OYV80428.1 MAG: hypothetical protein B7Z65_00850 [Ferrovum sp. 21-44-67]OYV94743.1 MAG: hypothetical protein B7Z60_02780 [Ferrovum sp. 37-45-19]OZB31883.1 MAG: hypothetical protein B7X47_08065 [Ferrovum sp. 34-44-207]HQT81140.1 FAD-dependent monooxygenase [Ferrovaceae bacterium]KRH79133.1 2-octaprenyl-3-methyl-6-methoxy-1,4-benzoquinol hydroxylase [Ferrovum sp. JA12]